MNVIFETKSSATRNYPSKNQQGVIHNGQRWKKVGESDGRDISNKEKFGRAVAFIGMIVAGILGLGIPFAATRFRDKVEALIHNVKTGKELNIHYMQTQTANILIYNLNKVDHCDKYITPFLDKYVGTRMHPVPEHNKAEGFLRIKFDLKEIKKEFPIRNSDGSPLTLNSYKQAFKKAKQEIKQDIQKMDMGGFMGKYYSDHWQIKSPHVCGGSQFPEQFFRDY